MKYKLRRDLRWCNVWILWLLRSLWKSPCPAAKIAMNDFCFTFIFQIMQEFFSFTNLMRNHSGNGVLENKVSSFQKCSYASKLTRGNARQMLISQKERELEIIFVLFEKKHIAVNEIFFSLKKNTEQSLRLSLCIITPRNKCNRRHPKTFHLNL